jgi:hypothetical protein
VSLPREDYLRQAQALPVGGKKRVRHNFESSAAMDVYNDGEKWSAYCHRCHQGGAVYKEHQRLQRVVVEPDRITPVPATVIRLSDATLYEQNRIWELLCRKGCPPGVIPEEMLWYERSVQRLMLRSGTLALGRALDQRRLPKWLPYGAWHGLPMVWTTRHGAVGTLPVATAKPSSVVLTEDALSAHKVAKAIDIYAPESSLVVIASLGTIVTDRFLPYVVNRPAVVCMYDGDPAGLAGFNAMRKRLSVWGQPVVDRRPAVGDPKNVDLSEIVKNLEEFL